MKLPARIGYALFKKSINIILQLLYDFRIWRTQELPEGPKIYCSNHFSSSDSHFAVTLMPEPIHMVIGSAFGVPVIGTLLRWGEQISTFSDQDRKMVITKAVDYLKKGESIYIFPEGDLGNQLEMRKFHTGVARIYLAYPVPIVPIGLISPRRNVKTKELYLGELLYRQVTVASKNYYANIGSPLKYPQFVDQEDTYAAAKIITENIKHHIELLIDDIKSNKFWN